MTDLTACEVIKFSFDLNRPEPIFFWKSEWGQMQLDDPVKWTVGEGYLIYRCLFMVHFLAVSAFNMGRYNMNFYFVFFTNWTFTLQTIYSTIYFFRLLLLWFKRKNIAERKKFSDNYLTLFQLPWIEKFIWIMINIVGTIPYAVALGFWGLVFKIDEFDKKEPYVRAASVLIHINTALFAFIDALVIGVPIRKIHFIFPVAFVVIYGLYTLIHEKAGGNYPDGLTYFYSYLNWKETPNGALASVFFAVLFLGILHSVFCYGLYRLRLFLLKVFARQRYYERYGDFMTDFDDKRRSVNPQRKKSEAPKIYFKGISISTTGTGESSQSGAGTIPRSSANPSSETTSGESTMSPSSIQVRKSPAEIMKSGPGPMMSRRSNRTSFPMVPKRRTKSTASGRQLLMRLRRVQHQQSGGFVDRSTLPQQNNPESGIVSQISAAAIVPTAAAEIDPTDAAEIVPTAAVIQQNIGVNKNP